MNDTNKKNRRKRINVSIALFIIWLICIAVYFIFTSFIKPRITFSLLILSAETLLAIFLWLFFMIKIEWLKDITTGKEIYHLNISNALSSLRFLLVPLLIAIFGLTIVFDGSFKIRIAIFLFAVAVALTDMFDGYLARRLKEVTNLGKIIDPVGDFLMITAFSILLFYAKIIELWFFILTMIRIPGLFVSALFIISLDIKIKIKTTKLGKTTIFYILTLLGFGTIKLLLELKLLWYDIFLLLAQIIGSILIIASSIEKIAQLFQLIKDQDKLKQSKDNIQF